MRSSVLDKTDIEDHENAQNPENSDKTVSAELWMPKPDAGRTAALKEAMEEQLGPDKIDRP
jgi:hypothetical protein